MQNERKIPRWMMALQIFYLSVGVYFHVVMRHRLRIVFDEMNITDTLPVLTMNTPFVIAVLGGVFLRTRIQ